jgi:hypothetical protein
MLTINVNNLEETLSKISKTIEDDISAFLIKTSRELKRDLEAATPVDTGLASDSWRIAVKKSNQLSITNDVPYIEELNNGSSKQAPAHFVETIALQYGKPIGSIITVSES